MGDRDDAGHVFRSSLPRPLWTVSRWSRSLFGAALLLPLFALIWAFLAYPARDVQDRINAHIALGEDLDASMLQTASVEMALARAEQQELPLAIERLGLELKAEQEKLDSLTLRHSASVLRLDTLELEMGQWKRRFMVRGVLALSLSGLAVCFAFVGGLSAPPTEIEVRQNGVQIDREWISAIDIVRCEVDGNSLMLRQVDGVRRLGRSPSRQDLVDIAAAISSIAMSSEERQAEYLARADILHRQRDLAGRLPD